VIVQPTWRFVSKVAAPAEQHKMLFILGASRSGSMLFSRLLGHVIGFFYVGELHGIWTPLFQDGVLCGFRIPFKCCAFWTAGFVRAFGGMEYVDARMEQLRASGLRLRWLPLLMCPRISRKYRDDIQHYSQVIRVICRAAQEVSGCRVLIDYSKFNQDCIVLNRTQDVELHVVHLVRDSRAAAYSRLKTKQWPQFLFRTEFMHQFGIQARAREWLSTNALSEAMRRWLKHRTRIYYVDLAADPRGMLTRICLAIRGPDPTLDFSEGQTAHLGKKHTVAGNPRRSQEGPAQTEPPTGWKPVGSFVRRLQARLIARLYSPSTRKSPSALITS